MAAANRPFAKITALEYGRYGWANQPTATINNQKTLAQSTATTQN